MNQSIILIFISILCVSCVPGKRDEQIRDPARPYINIVLNTQPLVWKNIAETIESQAEAGYVDVDINGFKWRYHCIIPAQAGHDELVMTEAEFSEDQIEHWCHRNKGKYAALSFGENVSFQTVKLVGDTLDTLDIKYNMLRKFEDGPHGIRIDIDRQNRTEN